MSATTIPSSPPATITDSFTFVMPLNTLNPLFALSQRIAKKLLW